MAQCMQLIIIIIMALSMQDAFGILAVAFPVVMKSYRLAAIS